MRYPPNRQSRVIIAVVALSILMVGTGATIGITWRKTEVIPVVLVKPGIGGFEPVEGSSIGNSWGKDDVLPIILVELGVGGFVPLHILSQGSSPAVPASAEAPTAPNGKSSNIGSQIAEAKRKLAEAVAKIAPAGDGPAIIETTMDGEFEGWEGETIFKLANGQIWQQVTYAYTYHYTYRPKVMIIKINNAYKMKVHGVDGMIYVKRLR